MTLSTTWRVWLDDERLARTRAVLADLGQRLLDLPSDQIPQPPGLVAGLSGIALAHAYLARAGLGDAHEERCAQRIEEAVATADALAGDGSLARGVSGFAFVLEHLGANEDDDQCAELDELLREEVRVHDDLPPEMMWGLAGRAIYARERLPRPSARALHDAAVARILEQAKTQPDGTLGWTADARYAGPTAFDAAGQPALNLGVAHGVPGIVTLLAAGEDERARAAARDGMRWIWAQRFDDGPAAFPVVAGGPPYHVHGWCYGDEGIGGSLFSAACALGDVEWQARWLAILRRCVARAPHLERGLMLCHGTAGTAHIWHRVYQATSDATFAAAARGWLDATLDGLARGEPDGPGILDGTAGIALALAAFVSDVEPAWDRLFLLSTRRA